MPPPPMLYCPSIYVIQINAQQNGTAASFVPISARQQIQTFLPVTERIIVDSKNRQQIQRKKTLLKIKDPNTGRLIEWNCLQNGTAGAFLPISARQQIQMSLPVTERCQEKRKKYKEI